MGTIRSQKSELQRSITDQKNDVLTKMGSQKTDLHDEILASKAELLESMSELGNTPNVTFRANGISSMGDPGESLSLFNSK